MWPLGPSPAWIEVDPRVMCGRRLAVEKRSQIQNRLKLENEAHFNRSAKTKPTASPALKTRFFLVFKLIR
jgi:hypothetical protein